MELTRKDTAALKGMGIIFMVFLHLFCRKDIEGYYEVFFTVNDIPLVYYISLLGDACRPLYLIASGYAFYYMVNKYQEKIYKKNAIRIFKLFINFWIVLLLFAIYGLVVGKSEINPGSLTAFLLNFFSLSNSYNGAWWFLKIYFILVVLSPLLVKLVIRNHTYFIILFSGVLYIISYYQRARGFIDGGENIVMTDVIQTFMLLGTSQFSFIIGIIFAKERVYSKVYNLAKDIKYKNTICCIGIVCLIVIHSFIESAIIAPINGIFFVIFFTMIKKNKLLEQLLDYLSKHSTNIWLTHMFFYITFFPELTFAPKYPILIFPWLLLMCIGVSYIINMIYNPIIRFVDKKLQLKKENLIKAKTA